MSLQLQLVETFLEELPSAAYCNQISLARLLMHFELILDKILLLLETQEADACTMLLPEIC